jgi:pre-mRNA cleavage complex 2 protein Pcf11
MNTRRAMEELFRSWKHPIPESRDPRPVFPNEVTQPIDAALIKFRSVNLKAKQEEEQARLQKMRTAQLPSRVTANFSSPRQTPPNGSYYQPPPSTVGQNSNANSTDIASMMTALQRGSTPNYPPGIRSPAPMPSPVRHGVVSVNQPYIPPSQSSTPSQYTYSGLPPPHMSHEERLNKLRADVQGLIESAKAYMARNPYDNEKSKLLQNLTNLKGILDVGQLSLVHIQSTELVVANIAKDLPPLPSASAPPALPHINPSLLASLLSGATPQPSPPPQPASVQPYAAPVQTPIQGFAPPQSAPPLPPVSMAQMMALLNPSTPTLSAATPATAPSSTNSFLDQLRASGLLGGTPTPVAATPVPPPPPSFNFMNMQQSQAPSFYGQPDNDVRLDSASLKL